MDEEFRNTSQRQMQEYSSTQRRADEIEKMHRQLTVEYEDLKNTYEYTARDLENCNQELINERHRVDALQKDLFDSLEMRKRTEQ